MLLIVDDSETSRYVKGRILRQAGYEVAEAATGAEALAAIKALRPDLMLLDIGLPDMNGFEVCQRVKSDPATAWLMVLEISATYVHAADTAWALESGADACLTEPIEPAVLLATVRSLLRLRDTQENLSRTNATLNGIISSSPAAIITLDAAGAIRAWNPAAEKIFGWTEAELIGKPPPCMSGNGNDDLRELVQHSLEGVETRYACKNGAQVDVAVLRAPLHSGNGAPAGSVLMALDISSRKQAEEQREQLHQREREARRAAEEASRAKDQFLAVLSHELRSPLNAILTWVSFLQKGNADSRKGAQALDAIERNARLQTELIGDLLDVSRIITGKLRLDIGLVDLASVVDAALETVRPAADSKRIRIATTLEPVSSVAGDPARLQQVVWNLLSNAVKFTGNGGAIELSLSQADGQIRLLVRDTGIGIAAEFLPRVFERFRQADASSTRSEGGLGLGLAIVRHLVELHGGTVRADSKGIGHGAAFT
ncbi:MAG: ATP-binding protein, partial [Candidatus Binataceae bacterium]